MKLQAIPGCFWFTCRRQNLYRCAAEAWTPITVADEVKLVNLGRIVPGLDLDITRIVLLLALREACAVGLIHSGIGDLHTPDIFACPQIRHSVIGADFAGIPELPFRVTLGKSVPRAPPCRHAHIGENLVSRRCVRLREGGRYGGERGEQDREPLHMEATIAGFGD
jgi:hypothetical protein